MSAYAELCELIGESADAWLMSGHRVAETSPEGEAAKAVIAAGYRKPRTITANAELDALPNHSVIVDKDADIWQKRGDEWCSYETNPHISVRLLKYAPLTVIHEGGVA